MARRITIASILFSILLIMPLSICGAEQEYHVIQTGETLYSIAKSYAIPYEMLASVNGITDPSKIRPGIVLLIPQTHTVAKGETYYGISKKYEISIQELKTANSLADSYVLRVGDVLMIPEKGSALTVAAQTSVPATATAPTAASPSVATPSVVTPAASAAPVAAAPVSQQPASPKPAAPAQTAAPPSSAPASTAPAASAPASASSPAQPAAPVAATTAPAATPAASKVSADSGEKNAQRATDALITWPVDGKGQYMSGKLEGIMFQTKKGAQVQAVASGTVVSAGPSRGFGEVVFVQSKSGFVYVYGGNESILVKTGDSIAPGKAIATVGLDTKDGSPTAYFFVFRNGQPVDPSLAPRE